MSQTTTRRPQLIATTCVWRKASLFWLWSNLFWTGILILQEGRDIGLWSGLWGAVHMNSIILAILYKLMFLLLPLSFLYDYDYDYVYVLFEYFFWLSEIIIVKIKFYLKHGSKCLIYGNYCTWARCMWLRGWYSIASVPWAVYGCDGWWRTKRTTVELIGELAHSVDNNPVAMSCNNLAVPSDAYTYSNLLCNILNGIISVLPYNRSREIL